MDAIGRKRWVIPEGFIPSRSMANADRPLLSHEAFCVLNAGDADAHVTVTLFFTDREDYKQFFYPLNKTMVEVDRDDPPGTHLLVVIAGNKPIGEQLLENLSTTPPPFERLMFWSNSDDATSRGQGREFETVDSYLAALAGRLPEGQKLVAALFLPVGP